MPGCFRWQQLHSTWGKLPCKSPGCQVREWQGAHCIRRGGRAAAPPPARFAAHRPPSPIAPPAMPVRQRLTRADAEQETHGDSTPGIPAVAPGSAGSERVRCASAPVHVPQGGCRDRSARVTHRNGAAGGGARRVRGAGAEVDVADWRLRLGVEAAVHLRNVVRRVCQQQLRIGGLCANCKHVSGSPWGTRAHRSENHSVNLCGHGAGGLTTWHACAAMRCGC